MIADVIIEIIEASRQEQPVKKQAAIPDLIAELFRLLQGTAGKQRQGCRVDITERGPPRISPAEDIGDRPVTQRHIPIQTRVEKVNFRCEKALFVNGEVVTVAVVVGKGVGPAGTVGMVLGRGSVAVEVLIFIAERQTQGVRRLPGDDRPQHQRVLYAKRLTGMFIFEPTLILIGIHGEACSQGLGQRGVQRTRDVDVGRLAPAFHCTAHRSLVAVSRRSGVEQHRATDDVAAEQHTLRATQHLDSLQVEGVVQHRRVRAHIHAVDEYADRRVNTRNRTVDAQTREWRSSQSRVPCRHRPETRSACVLTDWSGRAP